MLAKGDEEFEEEEDELTPMIEIPRHVKPKTTTAEKSAEKEVGEVGPKEPVDPVVSQEDIMKDWSYALFFSPPFVYI